MLSTALSVNRQRPGQLTPIPCHCNDRKLTRVGRAGDPMIFVALVEKRLPTRCLVQTPFMSHQYFIKLPRSYERSCCLCAFSTMGGADQLFRDREEKRFVRCLALNMCQDTPTSHASYFAKSLVLLTHNLGRLVLIILW